MAMLRTRKDVQKILRQGVPGSSSEEQASNLVLQFIIMSTDPIDTEASRYLVRFFTPQDYDDSVEERTVISKCGYPLCPHTLRDTRGNVRNPQSRTVLPWQHSYCQLSCYQAGQFYKEQSSREPLITRRDVAWLPYGTMKWENDVLILHEVRQLAKLNHKSIVETVKEIVKHQGSEARMHDLQIDNEEEAKKEAAHNDITSSAVKEHYNE